MMRWFLGALFFLFLPEVSWAEVTNAPSAIYHDKQLTELRTTSIQQITVPIVYENGILFTYLGKETDEVYISGEFWKWSKKRKLKQNLYGIHYIFVSLEIPKGIYPYRYVVNDIWINDPQQPHQVDDGYGTRISALLLEKNLVRYIESPKHLGEDRFTFFLKDEGFKVVSLIGSRNNWDPYAESMVLKDNYWTLTVKVNPKKTFYLYWVDGKSILDPKNLNVAMRRYEEKVNFIPSW